MGSVDHTAELAEPGCGVELEPERLVQRCHISAQPQHVDDADRLSTVLDGRAITVQGFTVTARNAPNDISDHGRASPTRTRPMPSRSWPSPSKD
ncbi:hypothetical protein [Streptomyces sp. NPDC001165]|uniref:hypothetical protein n=1 Tax=Streptomyces sp. NPDC001165 TaxID=3364546 RepID=UPI0036C8E4C9